MFKEIPKQSRYGYVRVSSKSQQNNSSLEAQTTELIKHGVMKKNIFIEIASAASNINERPILFDLVNRKLQADDLLLVTKIDRCSRNTLDFLNLQEKLHERRINFISLDLPYSSDVAVNKLISTTLASISTFENERRRERQRMGIQNAKKNGKYIGRKTVIDRKLISQVQDLKERKKLSISEIAKITSKSRTTVYKVLKQELNYIPYNKLVKKEN